MTQEIRVCLHSVALPLRLLNSETYQSVLTMFSEELDSKQQLAQQREAVSSRGMCGGDWGLGTTCPGNGGLCLHRRSPPPHTHCLTKRASASLSSLFLDGTGRKGNSGAKPPAPAAAASTHSTWCGGTGGAPSTTQSKGGSTLLPPTCQPRYRGLMEPEVRDMLLVANWGGRASFMPDLKALLEMSCQRRWLRRIQTCFGLLETGLR